MKPMFAVKDRAIDGFSDPFAHPSVQHAVRWYSDNINAGPETSAMAKHPDDYDLYQIGEYDEVNGIMHPVDMPQLVKRGKDLVQK